jgi:monoamine oxidase
MVSPIISPTISRRSVLAGLAGAALTPRGVRAATPPGVLDVLVIGAGLSGLYAATLLEELGARVQVVEGRRRIGGRLYTRFDLPGHPEVGGNTIASGYGRAIDLARRVGVELIDYAPRLFAGPEPALVIQGELIAARDWPSSRHNQLPDEYRQLLPWQIQPKRLAGRNPLRASADWLGPGSAGLDVPLHAYFRSQGLSEAEISLAYDASPYFGDSSWAVSALMFLFNDRWINEQRAIGKAAYAVAGGNQRLPQAMAAKLKREVRLGHEVTAIEGQGDRVRVYLRDREPIDAAQVISSLPLSKLRDVSIRPSLEGAQLEAVRSVRYMRNTLVFLVPKKPFWEQDGLPPSMWTDGRLGTVTAQKFGSDPNEVTGFVVNARGWSADSLDRLGEATLGTAVLREIERLRPAAKGALEVGGWHSWWLDPFSAGDWAIYGPGQVTRLVPQVAKPHGRLHFCGEHAGLANRGMESALESAEAAAVAVAARL